MKNIACLLLIVVLCTPFLAHAETVLRIGENITVDAEQVVDGDYYVSVGPFGNTTMSGVINGDMYAFGGAVTANGTVDNDLTIIGGATQMHASVTDDVRIVGGEVVIGEHIGGDLFVIGGTLKVLSTASVDGDLIFFGGEAEINGKVGGSVLGTSEKIRIDSEVVGDVDIKTATTLTLGDKAVIGGSVTYASIESLVRAQNATIGGELTQNGYIEKAVTSETKFKDALIPIFITLFATLSLYLLFRKELLGLVGVVQQSPLRSSLLGLGILILGPVVSIMLMATVLGVLVGVITASLVVLAYVIGYALSGVILGAYISKFFAKNVKVNLLWVLIGTLSLQALFFIPFVGPVIVITLFCITVGGIVMSVYKLLS